MQKEKLERPIGMLFVNRLSVAILCLFIGALSDTAFCEEPEDIPENKPQTVNTGIRTGRVVDAVTGKPIEGAVVIYRWDIEVFLVESSTRPGVQYETTTDKNGNYSIPSQPVEVSHPELSKLEPEEGIVYKYGYVCYMVDDNQAHSFMTILPELKLQYRKENNVVKLQPWADELSHSEHVRILTGMYSPKGPKLQRELKEELALAKEEQKAYEPFKQKVRKTQRQLSRDRSAYKNNKISRDEYTARLRKYLQIPDSGLLKLVSLALKDLDDTTAIPVLIEFLKKNTYRESFDKVFYSLCRSIGKTGLKAPRDVPKRKEIVAKIDDWWQRNKNRSSKDWNTDDITDFSGTPEDKLSQSFQNSEGLLIDPTLLETFEDPNNSPLAVFKRFRSALLAGDLEKVVSCFSPYVRAEYAKIYKELRPHFRKMAEGMNGLFLTSREDNVVVCDLLRKEDGEMFGYPMTFVKDEDGNWWIHGL